MTNLNRRQLLTAAGASALAVPLTATAAGAAPAGPGKGGGPGGIRTGAEVAAADRWRVLAGQKVGVVTNPTGILTKEQIELAKQETIPGRIQRMILEIWYALSEGYGRTIRGYA